MTMAKTTNPMGRHHIHRADGVRTKSCSLRVEELLRPQTCSRLLLLNLPCLHYACKSIACCFLWIFRHPRTSLLIDSRKDKLCRRPSAQEHHLMITRALRTSWITCACQSLAGPLRPLT